MLAVQKVVTNPVGKTVGVDKKLLTTDQEKWDMVAKLKLYVHNPGTYLPQPVKRVYKPKSNGKMRPLGAAEAPPIPTIEDRCLQALLNLVVEPLVEMTSDRHSYGFRKYRTAKMAIGAVRKQLGSRPEYYDKYVLDADIKGFFDNISHDWLLENVPLERTLKIILKGWLKAGSIHLDDDVEYGESGTPRPPCGVRGIISPTLANHTLNGLETTIEEALTQKYKVLAPPCASSEAKQRGIYIGKNETKSEGEKTKYRFLSTQLATIRFGVDFIVLARSRRMIEEVVRPTVERFLEARGLTLSPEKTKILSIRKSEPVEFLGYTFKYIPRISDKYRLYHDRTGRPGIACYPQKKKYQAIIAKLKAIIFKSVNKTAYELIAKLNPIVRGWAQYYNMSESFQVRNQMNSALYRLTWVWAKKKHPKWGKKHIAMKYYIQNRKMNKNTLENTGYVSGNDNKWVFHGQTRNESIYTGAKGGKTIELLNPTKVISTISASRYRIPENLELVHAYHPQHGKLLDFNYAMSNLAMQGNTSHKAKLLIRQKGLCGICGSTLLDDRGEFNYDGSSHIHQPRAWAASGSWATEAPEASPTTQTKRSY